MKKRSSSTNTKQRRSGAVRGFVVGRERFAQISAVEGIALTENMRNLRDEMDRQNLSASERRAAIIMRHTPTR